MTVHDKLVTIALLSSSVVAIGLGLYAVTAMCAGACLLCVYGHDWH